MLGFGQTFDSFVTAGEISLEGVKLFAGVIGFNDAKIRVQLLVSTRFARLSLQ